MEWDELSPEQQREVEADQAEFELQLVRVGVDLRSVLARLHEIKAPTRQDLASGDDWATFRMSFTVDVSGILETLRQLPDNAGASVFVEAYNAAHPDWRAGLS